MTRSAMRRLAFPSLTVSLAVSLAMLLSPCIARDAGAAETQEIRIPAAAAYSEPAPAGIQLGARGVTRWDDRRQQLVWYGWLSAGELRASIDFANRPAAVRYALRVSRVAAPADKPPPSAELSPSEEAESEGSVAFEAWQAAEAGYHRIALTAAPRAAADSKSPLGQPSALRLAGAAVDGAEFNLTPRRNTASVHLWYPLPNAEFNAQWFYNELSVDSEPLWSYYMACGFHRGYFGIQVNSPTERRIIFSVWDSGKEPVDRDKVPLEDRVQLLAKGQDVVAHGFGNEGTGGHSHLVYPWKKGRPYRFLVSAAPENGQTIFSGYFFFPEREEWGLIAQFKAPKEGGYLRGLYSFNENFSGANGQQLRQARFGNQWVRDTAGTWHELTRASFTHDGHGKTSRRDYFVGVEEGRFLLRTGGFLESRATYGEKIQRPPTGVPPEASKFIGDLK